MESQKAAVLQYFKTDRSLLGARNLYNQFPDRNRALQNSLARMSDNETNRSIAYYELAKHVGISERQLTILMNKTIEKSGSTPGNVDDSVKDIDSKGLTNKDKLLAFSHESAVYQDARSLVAELGLKVPNYKKETLFKHLSEARKELVAGMLDELPDETKASIKLREQFPFLRDPNCPDSLKILVNDLITTFEKFRDAQPKLHDLLSKDQEQSLAGVVLENYISNKQAYAELEHYKEKGEILGEHPIFERLAAKEEISSMSTSDLVGKIKNLGINIGKNKKKGNDDLVERDEDLLAHAEAVLKKR